MPRDQGRARLHGNGLARKRESVAVEPYLVSCEGGQGAVPLIAFDADNPKGAPGSTTQYWK